MRVSDGVAVGGAWAEGGLEGNSEQALGKVGQLEVWGAGAARWGLARRRGEAERAERCAVSDIDVLQLSPPFFLFLSFFNKFFARAKQRKDGEK